MLSGIPDSLRGTEAIPILDPVLSRLTPGSDLSGNPLLIGGASIFGAQRVVEVISLSQAMEAMRVQGPGGQSLEDMDAVAPDIDLAGGEGREEDFDFRRSFGGIEQM